MYFNVTRHGPHGLRNEAAADHGPRVPTNGSGPAGTADCLRSSRRDLERKRTERERIEREREILTEGGRGGERKEERERQREEGTGWLSWPRRPPPPAPVAIARRLAAEQRPLRARHRDTGVPGALQAPVLRRIGNRSANDFRLPHPQTISGRKRFQSANDFKLPHLNLCASSRSGASDLFRLNSATLRDPKVGPPGRLGDLRSTRRPWPRASNKDPNKPPRS